MKEKTFDEFWEELKNESPETRRELEVMEDCSSVIRQLVVARVDGGLTQKELAAKCGLTQSAIARMEKMQAMPRLDTLITVAKALNLSLSINNSLRLHTNYSARKMMANIAFPRTNCSVCHLMYHSAGNRRAEFQKGRFNEPISKF